MIAIDSNVFIYVLNAHPEFGPRAKKTLERSDAKVASELIFAEILSSPKLEASNLRTETLDFLEVLPLEYLEVTRQVLSLAAGLRRRFKVLKLADAIQLATALDAGAQEFITNDQELVKLRVPDLKIAAL